jgi:methyl-accepting chemotaxis protein
MGLNGMSIRARLLLAIGGLGALILAFAALTTVQALKTEREERELVQAERKAQLANEWLASTQLNVARVLAVAKSKANPDVDAFFKPLIAQTTQRINELQKELEANASDAQAKALMAEIAAKRQAYIDARNAYFNTLKAGDLEKADQQLNSGVLPAAESYIERQRAFVKQQHDKVDAELEQRLASRKATTLWVDGIALLAVLIAMAMIWSMVNSFSAALARAVGYAKGIAQGHLDQKIAIDRSDEIGDLLRAFSEMQTALERMVSTVHQTTAGINTAASEVASGNADLSSRTEATASSLEQTASSMEEITATVKQSADSARQANQLASTAAAVAAKGGEVVGQVVGTMQEIQTSSQKIADIIGVIDGIAFQTNILALNAAVEAARAGEQGRGFAVVAGEVRSLAQRSANAAKEIKDLITTSVERVHAGTEQVETAGKTMAEIVASVQRVNDIIGEITAAAGEQSNGIAQVNVAVNQLDQMTQQNAALVEQSAAAAQSLREQAARLSDAVNAFRVGADGRSAMAAPAPASYAPKSIASSSYKPSAGGMKVPASSPAAPKAAAAKPALKRPALSAPAGKPAASAPAAAAPAAAPKAAPAKVVAPKPSDDGDWETF